MHANRIEIEEIIEQPHIPVGRAARADMTQNFRALARQIFRTKRGNRACSHVGDNGRVKNGTGSAGARVKQVEYTEFRRIVQFVVVDEIADDFHPCQIQRCDISTQHIEMPVKRCIRLKMNPRFDHRLAIALRRKRDFNRGQNFCIRSAGPISRAFR